MKLAVRPRSNSAPPSPLLNREQAAEFLGVKEQTLACWQSAQRYKLPIVRVGRRVMYRLQDLERFIERGREDNGADDE
jgi:hypothetical protein